MRFVLCLFATLILAAACSRPPDEVRIRGAIEAMKTAAEARRPSDVLEHLADDFTGNNGEVDREGLAQLLRIQFLRSDAIGVDVGPIAVAIDENRAVAKFDITVSDRSRRWLPSGSETYAIVSGWRREGDGWICYNASWSNSAQ
jgi:hypothetical protein